MIVSVCNNRYKLDVLPLKGNQTQSGYLQFVNGSMRRIERNALCIEYCIKDLPTGMSVVEHFGGAGILGVMIEELLKPSSHILFDVDPDCLAQLKHLFGDKAQYGDAKELMGKIPADYIALDFNWFSLFYEHEWNLEGIFALKPRYVTIADIANQRMGIHREFLSKRLNRSVQNNEDYITAMSDRWYEKYGYSVRKAAYHIFSFMLLTPEPPTPIDFKDIRRA